MISTNLPFELSPDNALHNFEPPSRKEIERIMTMACLASRAMKMGDDLGDLSSYVSSAEATGIKADLSTAIAALETLVAVCAGRLCRAGKGATDLKGSREPRRA